MADILSKTQRSKLMSTFRSRDTKPEWILRCGLHRIGFRYRLENSYLPGNPDLIDAGFCGEIICTHGTGGVLKNVANLNLKACYCW